MRTRFSLLRARRVMPGGVSHELRYCLPHPIYTARAEGAHKWDENGVRYIDYKMGSAANLLGHGFPPLIEAMVRQARRAIFTADCHRLELEWAQRLSALYPSAELTRFTASGTEATMLAIRLARAYSGKPKLLRIEGHYHGWHDHVLKGVEPGRAAPVSLGVPDAVASLVELAPADVEIIGALLAADEGIGSIIVEASGANYGAVPLPEGFLQALRDLASVAAVC